MVGQNRWGESKSRSAERSRQATGARLDVAVRPGTGEQTTRQAPVLWIIEGCVAQKRKKRSPVKAETHISLARFSRASATLCAQHSRMLLGDSRTTGAMSGISVVRAAPKNTSRFAASRRRARTIGQVSNLSRTDRELYQDASLPSLGRVIAIPVALYSHSLYDPSYPIILGRLSLWPNCCRQVPGLSRVRPGWSILPGFRQLPIIPDLETPNHRASLAVEEDVPAP
jgi:hypothetical protein